MEYTGEREVPKKPGTIEGIDPKHVERYRWASSYTRGKNVYDIASGAGYGSLLLEALNYTGFDNSPEAVEYAKKYYGNSSVSFSLADANSMPEALKKTDVITSFETIEHIKEPESFLKWCSTHTNMLIISTPIRGSYHRSVFHQFEYRLPVFQKVLDKYFSKVTMFIQKGDIGINYPCPPRSHGVAVAVCQI